MGGAGGHMWHPFDCPDVNSGQNLIDFFKKTISAIKRNPAALKIDGVNLSFRLRENPGSPSGYEFVIDRGSMNPLDIEGVTSATADQRFVTKDGSPHGMVEATSILLSIFNAAIPDIMPELEELGMLRDMGPFSRYFNTEFVLKKINVKEYPFNFIAIHGVNKFEPKRYPDDYKKEELRGKIRYKKDGVTPSSKAGVPVEYDQGAVDRISEKVQSFAREQDFRTYTKIPADVKKSVLIEDALNEQFTIVYKGFSRDPEEPEELGAGEGSTKPIKVWLADVRSNPVKKKVNISSHMRRLYPNMGRSQTPYAKNIYLEILKGTPVTDIAEGPSDIEDIVDAVVVMHSTRMLGNAVLDALESDEFGSAREQEGVVIEDPEICGGTPFKFTGDFIVGGLASTFEEAKFKKGVLIREFQELPGGKDYVILIPGGFKPPTSGHYHMIKHYEKIPQIRKVFVVTGPKPREGVTIEQSKQIFDIYGGFSDKVEFITAPDKTPLTTCYELVKDSNFTNQFPNASFSIGASDKDGDKKRIEQFINYFAARPHLTDATVTEYPPAPALEVGGVATSASRMRKAYKDQDWETFKQMLPDDNHYDDVVQVLLQGGGLQENFLLAVPQSFLVERKLTSAEYKKKKEIAAAMPKSMPDDKKYAIATATAKRVAEDQIVTEQDEDNLRERLNLMINNVLARIPEIFETLIDDNMDDIVDQLADTLTKQLTGMDTEQQMTEMSSMAGGAVAGYSGPIGRDDDER